MFYGEHLEKTLTLISLFTRDFKPMLSGSPLRFPCQRCRVERLSLCPAPETCCFLLEAVRQSRPSCLTHQPASRSRSLSLVGATFGPSSTPLGVLLSFSLPLALGHRQSLTGSPLGGPRPASPSPSLFLLRCPLSPGPRRCFLIALCAADLGLQKIIKEREAPSEPLSTLKHSRLCPG